MNIIEQAAQRLEQLRQSGIDIPQRQVPPAPVVTPASPGAAAVPAADEPQPVAVSPARAHPQGPAAAAQRASATSQSRQVEIDLDRLAAMGYLTPAAVRSRIADEFRVIKRPLLVNVDGKAPEPIKRPNLIMVTSSLPGEGKTFVSLNLAMSLAMELDRTVLLVDADVSRPSVLSRLGLSPSRGLLDILTDASIGLPDVMLRTNVEKLTLLPSGKANGHATELLASETMNRLLDELSSRYADRIIVFDAPPLLPSTESRALATQMGQVVLVVEAEITAHKTLAEALATIEACPVVMPLLNKANQSEVGSYYGYYDPT